MRSSTGMGHVGRPQGQPGGCQFGLGEEDSRMYVRAKGEATGVRE